MYKLAVVCWLVRATVLLWSIDPTTCPGAGWDSWEAVFGNQNLDDFSKESSILKFNFACFFLVHHLCGKSSPMDFPLWLWMDSQKKSRSRVFQNSNVGLNNSLVSCEWKNLVTVGYFSRWWFQIFFIFNPIWGRWTHFGEYFSDGLKPPTSFLLKGNFYDPVFEFYWGWTTKKRCPVFFHGGF